MREALLAVLPILIAMIVVNLVVPRIMPRLKKREEIDNKNACVQREVRIDKAVSLFFKIAIIFVTLVSIAFMIPQVCEVAELDYVTMLIICGIMLVVMYLSTWAMLRQVQYNDEYCVYINALGLRKKFAYEDIVKIKYTLGFVRVSAAKKSFLIFKTFAGCDEFVAFVKEKNPNVTIII